MKKILFTLSLFAIIMSATAQSLNVPPPSPTQNVTQQFATSKIELNYSRPSAKGRKIFGGLVPYDKLWRTGANSCTKIYFGQDVTINGSTVKAGRYSLFTIPGKTDWEIIINKDTTLGGTNGYKIENDVLRFKVKSKPLLFNTETFTMLLDNLTDESAEVFLRWEKTEVSFVIKADIDPIVMKQIEDAMNPEDKKPYYTAARYYLEHDKDLDKALVWITKAEEQNPKAFWVSHVKAKIYLKKGDKTNAIAAAESSKQKAKDAYNEEYVEMNDKLIEEARKLK